MIGYVVKPERFDETMGADGSMAYTRPGQAQGVARLRGADAGRAGECAGVRKRLSAPEEDDRARLASAGANRLIPLVQTSSGLLRDAQSDLLGPPARQAGISRWISFLRALNRPAGSGPGPRAPGTWVRSR